MHPIRIALSLAKTIGLLALTTTTMSYLVAVGHAATSDEASVRTALPSTDVYPSVPSDLDVLHASPVELSRYGFPPRPDPGRSRNSYTAWQAAVTGMQRLVPVLVPVAIHHGPIRNMVSIDNQSATSINWSGYVAAADALVYGTQSIINIYGDWMVPIAQPAFNACRRHRNGADVYSSTWVGVDGSGSADVMQAGTESDSVCSNGQINPYQSAWYEWYPFNEVRIGNLPIAPGAAMSIHVWATSARRAHAYIADKSAHIAVSLAFDAPPGVTLVGNSAEWVVERPTVDGQFATLTNYVQEFFANAEAVNKGGFAYGPGLPAAIGQSPPLQIDMTDDTNAIISVPTLLGQRSIWFSDQGSAQTLPQTSTPG